MSKIQPHAMGFYHEDGFVPAYRNAAQYAGESGRVGTMLDVVNARINDSPLSLTSVQDGFETPWDVYFTTMSAEYVGYGRDGKKLLIVTHGVGPMATFDGVMAAYSWEYKDTARRHTGGRVSREEFLKLESGEYGDVAIVDIDAYNRAREYPFMENLTATAASRDPVVRARLGPNVAKYLIAHAKHARRYHLEQDKRRIVNPYVLKVDGPAEYWLEGCKPEEGMAYAHLLTLDGIRLLEHRSPYGVASWLSGIDTHDWGDGTRFLGVRDSALTTYQAGPDPYRLLRKKWDRLMVPSGIEEPIDNRFFTLMQMPDGTWFTQVNKKGHALDTAEPEFLVLSLRPLGEPVRFYTQVNHYPLFFKYGKFEVRAVMPPRANAYALVGEPENRPGHKVQTCLAQPYEVKVDHTRRLMRQSDLAKDFSKQMDLYVNA